MRCDPRPPRKTAAASPGPPSQQAGTPCCDPRPPRKTAAALGTSDAFRSLVAVAILGRLGRRPLPSALAVFTALSNSVAILGRLGRRPLHGSRRGLLPGASSCDPRPPRKTAAARCREPEAGHRTCCDPRPPRKTAAAPGCDGSDAGGIPVAILGRLGRRPLPHPRSVALPCPCGRCDPRPPRKTAAALFNSAFSTAEKLLRSSAASEDGRCPVIVPPQVTPKLRSSAASEDGRCYHRSIRAGRDAVAILGRLGRRPLHRPAPGHRGTARCDPRPPRKTAAALPRPARSLRASLRSSAASEDGRCRRVPSGGRLTCGCDPRPPRKTAAAGRARDRARDRVMLRSSAASEDGRCRASNLKTYRHASPDPVAILGRPGGRPLPRSTANCSARFRSLRSSAAPEDGRCSRVDRHRYDPRPVAILGRLGRRPLRSRCVCLSCSWHRCGCDPRPPRKTAAAPGEVRVNVQHVRAVAILGRLGRRPLSSVHLAAHAAKREGLRSSAASEDGRCNRP